MVFPNIAEYLPVRTSYFKKSTFTNYSFYSTSGSSGCLCEEQSMTTYKHFFFLLFYVVFAGCNEDRSSCVFVQTCKPASVFGFGIPQLAESYLVQDRTQLVYVALIYLSE